MTIWQMIWNNKVKIIGVILAVHSQLMVELAVYAMDGFVSALTLRLTGSIGTIFSVAVAAAGWSNTTKEKVAEAKMEVASAMQTAIEATPPKEQP